MEVIPKIQGGQAMRKIELELAKKNKVDYGTVNAMELEFDFDEIKLQKVYKYQSFCRLAGIKQTDSVNRRIVLNELKRYCIFEQPTADQIKIYSIFKKPRNTAPIKMGEFKKQFNLSKEDAFKSGIYAVIKDSCLVVGYCKHKKCFLDEFLTLVSPLRIDLGSPQDFVRKGGVFIPLEVDGEDFNGEVDKYSERMKYVLERLKKQDKYTIFNNTPRSQIFNRGRDIKVPFSNYDKAIKLLAENKLI